MASSYSFEVIPFRLTPARGDVGARPRATGFQGRGHAVQSHPGYSSPSLLPTYAARFSQPIRHHTGTSNSAAARPESCWKQQLPTDLF